MTKTKVIFDTNFLIYAIKHKINIDYELNRVLTTNYEIIILKCIVEELEKLKTQLKGKEKFSINILLSLIKKYNEEEYSNGKYADDIIVNYVEEQKEKNNKIVVCTNDKELKNKLGNLGAPIIIVKQKNYFELQGNI
ncbi:Nucleotide binding protein PINc [Methanococcus aeolicus Nankai-3]|uniref:Nucleotide binding protein PINc n=1 Tax=Methanococcus aeolicus (strain ATCC BAA-1280 / DSM 17508 / OCM 812 / Nankai-3) TaxID=419665 RepID=A6UUX1_META3|nr:PIN domain-containing protein [Methanococcus aeolicus]ABR56293.1 Nucleotide binding protein PINc [Methanococcus aeolicus Nankai-3]